MVRVSGDAGRAPLQLLSHGLSVPSAKLLLGAPLLLLLPPPLQALAHCSASTLSRRTCAPVAALSLRLLFHN